MTGRQPTARRQMRYVAQAVDQYGVSLATYEFECRSDEEAREKAGRYLAVHHTIDLWADGRRVSRLTWGETERSTACAPKG
jgi:hypothetical protein